MAGLELVQHVLEENQIYHLQTVVISYQQIDGCGREDLLADGVLAGLKPPDEAFAPPDEDQIGGGE